MQEDIKSKLYDIVQCMLRAVGAFGFSWLYTVAAPQAWMSDRIRYVLYGAHASFFILLAALDSGATLQQHGLYNISVFVFMLLPIFCMYWIGTKVVRVFTNRSRCGRFGPAIVTTAALFVSGMFVNSGTFIDKWRHNWVTGPIAGPMRSRLFGHWVRGVDLDLLRGSQRVGGVRRLQESQLKQQLVTTVDANILSSATAAAATSGSSTGDSSLIAIARPSARSLTTCPATSDAHGNKHGAAWTGCEWATLADVTFPLMDVTNMVPGSMNRWAGPWWCPGLAADGGAARFDRANVSPQFVVDDRRGDSRSDADIIRSRLAAAASTKPISGFGVQIVYPLAAADVAAVLKWEKAAIGSSSGARSVSGSARRNSTGDGRRRAASSSDEVTAKCSRTHVDLNTASRAFGTMHAGSSLPAAEGGFGSSISQQRRLVDSLENSASSGSASRDSRKLSSTDELHFESAQQHTHWSGIVLGSGDGFNAPVLHEALMSFRSLAGFGAEDGDGSVSGSNGQPLEALSLPIIMRIACPASQPISYSLLPDLRSSPFNMRVKGSRDSMDVGYGVEAGAAARTVVIPPRDETAAGDEASVTDVLLPAWVHGEAVIVRCGPSAGLEPVARILEADAAAGGVWSPSDDTDRKYVTTVRPSFATIRRLALTWGTDILNSKARGDGKIDSRANRNAAALNEAAAAAAPSVPRAEPPSAPASARPALDSLRRSLVHGSDEADGNKGGSSVRGPRMPNVLYIMADATSRMQAVRKLPKTMEFLRRLQNGGVALSGRDGDGDAGDSEPDAAKGKYANDGGTSDADDGHQQQRVRMDVFESLRYHSSGFSTGLSTVPMYTGWVHDNLHSQGDNARFAGGEHLAKYGLLGLQDALDGVIKASARLESGDDASPKAGDVDAATAALPPSFNSSNIPVSVPLWRHLSRSLGYVSLTTSNECEDWGSTFNWALDPSDHDMASIVCTPPYHPRPHPYGPFRGPYSIRSRCVGSEYAHKPLFDYVTTFWDAYPAGVPKFALVNLMEGHEGSGEVLADIDEDLALFLRDIFLNPSRNGYKDTVVYLAGDHGLHMGPGILFSAQGSLEHMQPMLFTAWPQEHHLPIVDGCDRAHLRKNQQHLVSGLDLYTTLLELQERLVKNAVSADPEFPLRLQAANEECQSTFLSRRDARYDDGDVDWYATHRAALDEEGSGTASSTAAFGDSTRGLRPLHDPRIPTPVVDRPGQVAVGRSLFGGIAESRDCNDAGVPADLCKCTF